MPRDYIFDGDDLRTYLNTWGPMDFLYSQARMSVFEKVMKSGLNGRGGAWFPTFRKWEAAMSSRKRPVLVINGSESEPASAKDALLLSQNPHLVIDGAIATAYATSANKIIFFVHAHMVERVARLLSLRRKIDFKKLDIEVISGPESYVTGEASALVHFINGGPPAKPLFTKINPVHKVGVGGGPTIVQNVETVAHVGLIARFGNTWFRELGTANTPGTLLLTITGIARSWNVTEVAVGTTLREAITRSGGISEPIQAILLGGYGANWHKPANILDVPLDPRSLVRIGASLGPGIVFLLGESSCPVFQMARIARWMAEQGAGQCGPCLNGLPAIASGLEAIASYRAKKDVIEKITRICKLVEGRGACHHPDGVSRMILSGLAIFHEDIESHLARKNCGRRSEYVLPNQPLADLI